jgi:voltage-gated potassium channel
MLLNTRIRLALNLLVAVIVVATVFYNIVEGWGLINSLYFSVSTATTVGYGDLAPTTMGSKIFTTVYMLASTGLALYSIALLAQKRILFHIHRMRGEENTKTKTGRK